MKLKNRLSKIAKILAELHERTDIPVKIKLKVLEAALEVEKLRRERAKSA